jgi:hypothetical protein
LPAILNKYRALVVKSDDPCGAANLSVGRKAHVRRALASAPEQG